MRGNIRRPGKRAAALAGLAALVWVSGAQAQVLDFTITSAPSPVGSGARAMGQAGAFIATADDATAASWNPAALIILEHPEASVVGSSEAQARSFAHAGTESFDYYAFNYLSASYPFSIKEKNFVVSLNYQRLYDFNYKLERSLQGLVPDRVAYNSPDFSGHPCWDFSGPTPKMIPCTAGTPTDPSDDYYLGVVNQDIKRIEALRQKITQQGDIGAVGPALAMQITPKIALGVAYNFWMDGLLNRGYTRTTEQSQKVFEQNNTFTFEDLNLNLNYDPGVDAGYPNPGVPKVTRSHVKFDEKFKFRGQNFNAGLLLNLSARNKLGLVYRSGFDANIAWKVDMIQTDELLVGNSFQQIGSFRTSHQSQDLTMHFPDQFGIGFSNRFSDAFTMALDLTYVRWDAFTAEHLAADPMTGRSHRETFSAVSGLLQSRSHVDPVATVRLGAEYIFIREKIAVPLRAGAFYDPQPAEGAAQNYWGGTLGAGIAWKSLVVDAAYVYRFANDVDLITVTNPQGTRLQEIGKGDIQQHSFLLSTIYHF